MSDTIRIDQPKLNPSDLPVGLYLKLDSLARHVVAMFKTDDMPAFSTAMEQLDDFLAKNKPKLDLAACIASRTSIPLDPDRHGIPH